MATLNVIAIILYNYFLYPNFGSRVIGDNSSTIASHSLARLLTARVLPEPCGPKKRKKFSLLVRSFTYWDPRGRPII